MGKITDFFSDIIGLNPSAKSVENVTDIGKTVTDGIVKGIDVLILTDEEKIQYNQKATEVILKFWETFSHENSEQSKARRELAKMTFKQFWNLIWIEVAAKSLSLAFPQIDPLVKVVHSIAFSTVVVYLVLGVAATYFVPHQVSKLGTLQDLAGVFGKGKNPVA